MEKLDDVIAIGMTEQEQIQFYELLQKFIVECDMQYIHVGQKAQDLLDAINDI